MIHTHLRDPMLVCWEKARKRMRKVPKAGQCDKCHAETKTVWHSCDHAGSEGYDIMELCFRCHRDEHRDEKHKGPERRCWDTAYTVMRSVPKTGKCVGCRKGGKTFWHTRDRKGCKGPWFELCYACHRAAHRGI